MNYKICTKCGKKLEATTEFFHKTSSGRGKFGLRADCKECCNKAGRKYNYNNPNYTKERAKKWRANNVEHRKEYEDAHRGEYYRNNKEKCNKASKLYYELNKKKVKAYYREWAKNNQDKRNAAHARRKARKLKQTPDDANMKLIQLYYKTARELDGYEVDHIKPLSKGGLHHEDNLQLLPRKLNNEKNARWPLTPEEEKKYMGIRI